MWKVSSTLTRMPNKILPRATTQAASCARRKNNCPSVVNRASSSSSSSSENSTTPNHKLSFSRSKSGTPSPWAVYDVWELNDEQMLHDSPSSEHHLDANSVAIPMTQDEREAVPSESDILQTYEHLLQRKSSVHFGYPYNLLFDYREVMPFLQYSINNLGDPFVPSNYGVHSRPFEVAVIDFFARLWHMPQNGYWGYVTTSGTEGNLHGILLARERLPDGILYTSQESHYSVFKAARYYRMQCESIPTLPMGEIDYDVLQQVIHENKEQPVILNVNIGTTVKGAVDNLDRILQILQDEQIPRERTYIHCDGALYALMMPFLDHAPEVSFRKPIDSMTVSGHKMLGSPMPCGIALCRKEHVKNVEEHIDYLNSVDTTIMGSRNGHAPLYLWYTLRRKGLEGIQQDVMHCVETARYLRDALTNHGVSCRLNEWSSTVCLERPLSEDFVQRWQLACDEDICHVVVMPNVTRKKIDRFVQELVVAMDNHGRIEPQGEESPLIQLRAAW